MPPGPAIDGAAGDAAGGPGGPPWDAVDPPEGAADATVVTRVAPVETAGGLAAGDPRDGGVPFAISPEDAISGREATIFWIASATSTALAPCRGSGAA
jgi:hypothetical protein